MLFTKENAEKVMRDEKWQTRRPVKPGETTGPRFPALPESPTNRIVYDANGRVKWYTGGDYAIQPGRGKHGIGRRKVLSIRREPVRDISEADAKAEGCRSADDYNAEYGDCNYRFYATDEFANLWDSIYSGEYAWERNPTCWVLTFERVEE